MKPADNKRRSTYCLDTGPLLDYFLLEFFEQAGKQMPPQLASAVRLMHSNERLKGSFEKLLKTQGPFLTSPGVFIELCRHVQAGREYAAELREFFQQRFQRLRIEERHVSVEALDPRLLKDYGPVDASLMTLAQQEPREKRVLVTMDQPLYGACVKHRVRCMDVHELTG